MCPSECEEGSLFTVCIEFNIKTQELCWNEPSRQVFLIFEALKNLSALKSVSGGDSWAQRRKEISPLLHGLTCQQCRKAFIHSSPFNLTYRWASTGEAVLHQLPNPHSYLDSAHTPWNSHALKLRRQPVHSHCNQTHQLVLIQPVDPSVCFLRQPHEHRWWSVAATPQMSWKFTRHNLSWSRRGCHTTCLSDSHSPITRSLKTPREKNQNQRWSCLSSSHLLTYRSVSTRLLQFPRCRSVTVFS